MYRDNDETALLRTQLELVLEVAQLGAWTHDLRDRRLTLTGRARALLAMAPDEAATVENIAAHVHPDDRARVAAALVGTLAPDADPRVGFRVGRADAEAVTVEARVHIERDPAGRARRVLGTLRNVSAQHATEEALRRQTAYMGAILKHLPQGITVFDADLRLQYWNERFAEVLDLPHDLLERGVAFESLIRVPALRGEYGPGDPDELVRERRERALEFKSHHFERTRPNGRTHLISGGPMLIDGKAVGFITTYTDITAQKDSEKELASRNAVLQTLIENMPCGVSLLDRDLRLLASNAEFRRVLALPDALFDKDVLTLHDILLFNAQRGEYGPGDPHEIAEFLVSRTRDPRNHNFDRVRPDGTVLQIMGQTLPDGGFVTLYNDITARKEAEKRQELADLVFEQSPEAIVIVDIAQRIVSVNPAYCTINAVAAADMIGKVFIPSVCDESHPGAISSEMIWRLLNAQGRFVGEALGRRSNDEVYPCWLNMSTLRDGASGQANHFIAIFTDISERKEAEASIQHLAHHDPLTGLANRFSLLARLEQALADASRSRYSLAVMFLDLDRFKNINDSLGHHVGDDLLVKVGGRLSRSVRNADIVARLGGDEFVVVLHGVTDASVAAHVAEKLLATLSEPYLLEGRELHVTPSIGIALYPDDSRSAAELMRNADAAMYHAKALGRANFQFFTDELNRASAERLDLEGKLRRAIGRNELEVWYQPQLSLTHGRTVGVEALLRWRHPEHGLISPGTFIPLAEETRLIVEIGSWVLRTACMQAVAWHERGLGPLRLSVNLSPKQLRDSELLAIIAGILDETGLDPQQLELEITESSVMEQPEKAVELLGSLKRLGIKIAIDDFGTGYSSLSYLKLFPIDHLKIDRSFVSDIESDSNDAAIVTAAVSLAHNLGLSVIAEGVESAVQTETLRALGCDELQGYHFSPPLPAEKLELFLTSGRPS